MAKIVIIAPAEADDDVKDAVKLLKAAGHDVDTDEPTPKSLLHIVLGLMGPNGYGFGPGYAYLPGGGSSTPPPKDEPPAEEDPAEEPPAEDPESDAGGDDFNFESLGTVTVDGELIEAVTFDSETSVLCVEALEAGAKTTYSLNESVFSFFPADAAKPTLRVEVLVDKHRTSIEIPIIESEDKATLKVGKDLRSLFEAKSIKTYDDIDDFKDALAKKLNSAIDIWMREPQAEKLYKLYLAGAKIKAKSWDVDKDNEKFKRKLATYIETQKQAGFEVFAEEDNHDSYEVVMVKK